MKNIFENAYFGKPYRTRDGKKAIYIGENSDNLYFCIVDNSKVIRNYLNTGEETMFEHMPMDSPYNIIEEWQEEISEDEYENKIKSLIDSCMYWEAYEDAELFAKAFKELFDFAPNDKRTVDYCSDIIRSRKTIMDEVSKAIKSFMCQKDISDEELDKLAYEYCPKERTWATINGYKERDAFKAGFRARGCYCKTKEDK